MGYKLLQVDDDEWKKNPREHKHLQGTAEKEPDCLERKIVRFLGKLYERYESRIEPG